MARADSVCYNKMPAASILISWMDGNYRCNSLSGDLFIYSIDKKALS